MTRVLICVGPGGVGKTTVAAATAIRAARAGQKTLVLTIDPSQRLAKALGIEGTGEYQKVPGANYPGQLWAGIVDHRRTFDEFVRRAAGSGPTAEKLLQNRLYQQLSTTLSGSQDFTALERLHTAVRDGGFDLVILDTPPAQHAIEFLEAPAKIAILFNDSVARWFRDPNSQKMGFLQKVVSTGTRQIFRVLEMLTGSEFIRELADFFRQIESWESRLSDRTQAVHKLLTSKDTDFVIVTAADRAKLAEATVFANHLKKNGYQLSEVIVNRAVPDWWTDKPQDVAPGAKKIYDQYRGFVNDQISRVIEFSNRLKGEVVVRRLPEREERVYDLKGLEAIAEILEQETKS